MDCNVAQKPQKSGYVHGTRSTSKGEEKPRSDREEGIGIMRWVCHRDVDTYALTNLAILNPGV